LTSSIDGTIRCHHRHLQLEALQVREEDADRARRMIVEYSQNQPDADEEAEATSTEEPPATA
jgi:hypothetical protein